MATFNNSIGDITMNKLMYKLKNHIPDILTGVSIVGVGLTAYASHVDTLKQQEIFQNERPYTKSEKAICYLKSYWRTALAATGTVASIIFCRKITSEQLIAMAATCTAVEKRFGAYRVGVRNELGNEKERDIYIQTAQELDPDYGLWPQLPYKADEYDDSYVFYDLYSQTYFISSIEKVQQAMYHFNRNFVMRGFACVNEFYSMLGINDIPNGDNIGWESGDLMDSGLYPWINFYSDLKEFEDGVKYYVISFEIDPTVEAMERAIG